MQFIQFTAARADSGAILPRATAVVYAAGTTTKASLFDVTGAAIPNPTIADATGLLGFSAADGLYDVQITAADNGYSVPLIRSMQIVDLVGLRGTVTSGRLAYATWAELNVITGTAGQVADIPTTDTGTHTDPAGGTVSNNGVFRYQTSPAGWHRIYDSITSQAAAYSVLAGHYANDGTDVDVPGGTAGERGSKFFSLQSAASAAISLAQAGIASGAALSIAAAANYNLHLILGVLNDVTKVENRLSQIENNFNPSIWIAALPTINAIGSNITLKVASTYAGGVFDPTKAYVRVWRQGFDALGNATVYPEMLTFGPQLRQVAGPSTNYLLKDEPVASSLVSITAWLSDVICAADLGLGFQPELVLQKGWYINGVNSAPAQVINLTNNSTRVAPKPFGNLISTHRRVVGNAIDWEIEAFSYFARLDRQVACVIVSATDGSTTVTQTVSVPTTSPRASDRAKIEVFAGSLDITSLTNNAVITFNYKLIPWIGTSASIQDTSVNTALADTRGMGPRYFLKNTSLFANPRLVYIDPAGNDSTGVASTTKATAQASPCLTVEGAMVKAHAAFSEMDGVEIRARAGTYLLVQGGVGLHRNQRCAAPVLTYDPDTTTPSAVVFSYGTTTSFNPRIDAGITAPMTVYALRFKACRILRTGTGALVLSNNVACNFYFEDIDQWDGASLDAAYLNANMMGWIYGCKAINLTQKQFGFATNKNHGIIRGLEASSTTVELFIVTGCKLTATLVTNGTATINQDGGFMANNEFRNVPDQMVNLAKGLNVDGFCIAQNLFERINAIEGTTMAISADAGSFNLNQYLEYGNVFTGTDLSGRENAIYNETNGTARTHTWVSMKNNIHVIKPTKHDIFDWLNNLDSGSVNHTGAWEYLNGVGCWGEWSQFDDGAGTGFQAKPEGYGPQSSITTSRTVRNDAQFVNYQGGTSNGSPPVTGAGTVGTYVAGAGGGDYHLAASSVARRITGARLFSYGLDGVARDPNAPIIGCYA